MASVLRGKHKPIFTPHNDTGDHVVVINARGIRLTGDKLRSKVYYHHSGYPGGLKYTTAGTLKNTKPERLVQYAIQGMLPKNKLGRAMLKKLRVYPDGFLIKFLSLVGHSHLFIENTRIVKKRSILEGHATRQWEYFCRAAYPGAGRYWEGKAEIDLVAPLPGGKAHVEAECKWSWLSKEEEKTVLEDLKRRFAETKLAKRLRNVRFLVLSKKDLHSGTSIARDAQF